MQNGAKEQAKAEGYRAVHPIIAERTAANRGDYHLCAYCGRRLYSGQWHWMYDEFGQLVHKCNDERACQKNRRPECEDSFRKAMKM